MRPLLSTLLCASTLFAQDRAPAPDAAAELFDKPRMVRFAIVLEAEDRKTLAAKPREYVPCSVRVDGKTTWTKVGVKLKGAAGSFRELDDRPGFTLHLGKYGETQRLFGLRRFHLNNGVQDESRLSEWVGARIFAAAGYPAPRVAHARVSLDGKDLGLYVLREAFDQQFVERVFGDAHGNLYDGGFCQDVDAALEKDAGDGPDDRSDLRKLCELCRHVDPERATRLAQAIDVDAFLDFCALEAMLGHWDGYCQNRNNFRVWLAAPTGRAHFLPHGMDQLFGDSDASVLRHPQAIVASAILQHPAWRQRYRKRLEALLPLFQPRKLQAALDAVAAVVRKEVRAIDAAAVEPYENAVRDLGERIEARYRNLQAQVKAPEPQPLALAPGKPQKLDKWLPAGETDFVELAKKGFQGVTALSIGCTRKGPEERRGAWRTTVLLGKGRYRLVAAARAADVEGLKDEGGAVHGGVRLAVDDARSDKLFGDHNWRTLECEFEVVEFQRDVELRLEFAGHAGRGWFRCDSLQIVRVAE